MGGAVETSFALKEDPCINPTSTSKNNGNLIFIDSENLVKGIIVFEPNIISLKQGYVCIRFLNVFVGNFINDKKKGLSRRTIPFKITKF
ncbi:hypothetical protein FFWV33_18020 [Flavobacterium faecale]|uniref:Uncharacterized protein n=1 Tax=Flavobacterium faecale TaxID=1355330 RepID=A0A2S1LHU7_9FLAO|nr:hypothetical protein FFWV33_18020 [Flavobacterium faecale]